MKFTGISEIQAAALLSGSLLLLALLFLLRGRRRKLVVGTFPVWTMLLGRSRVDFRALFALFFEMLAAAMLCLALTGPTLRGTTDRRQALAILVDQGVTSSVITPRGTRLLVWSRFADKVLKKIPEDVPVLVAGAADHLDILAGPWASKGEARAALAKLETKPVMSMPMQAVETACRALSAWTSSREPAVLYIGGEDELPEAQLENGCRLYPVGLRAKVDNLAITGFMARRTSGFGRGYRLFVKARNFASRTRKTRLSVYSPSTVFGSEEVSIPGRGSIERSYKLDEEGGTEGRLAAGLQGINGRPADGFALDDTRYAVVPKGRRIKVLLVTQGNLFFSKGLAVNPAVSLETMAPVELKKLSTGTKPDVVVLDDTAMPKKYSGNMLLFGPNAAGSRFKLGKEIKNPVVYSWNIEHPLLRNVRLSSLEIEKAKPIQAEPGDKVIASDSNNNNLMVVRDDGKEKILAIAFKLTDSDLPLKIAFPVMLANFTDWCVKAETSLNGREVGLGTFQVVDNGTGSGPVTVRGPGGLNVDVVQRAGGPSIFIREPGFYTITQGKNSYTLAANFTDKSVSARLARPLRRSDGTGEHIFNIISERYGSRKGKPDRPLTKILLLAALSLVGMLWIGHGTGLFH